MKIKNLVLGLLTLVGVGASVKEATQDLKSVHAKTEVKDAKDSALAVDEDGYLVFKYDQNLKTRKGSPVYAKFMARNGK